MAGGIMGSSNKGDKNKINFSKIKSIAKHEILSNIKRKQFIIMTVLIPIIFVAITLASAYFSSYATNQKIGYIDNFGASIPNNAIKYNAVQQKNITLSFKEYKNRLDNALENNFLRTAMDNLAVAYRTSRLNAFSEMDVDAAIKEVAAIKADAVKNNALLLSRFISKAKKKRH